MPEPLQEIKRRRTFAIISHPDAGKTTLTEKLLLYGGAIQTAGAVRARGGRRAATSDWMEMEKQRGISVTSTVLQFEYEDHVLNLLDTPGHEDFSEDTYRTLVAADSAVMIIDNAKGVEPQTIKLFKVCRQRGIPIFTFVNKLDRPGREPLELLEEIEDVLGIRSVPMVWPIGDGDRFKGVYDRTDKSVHLFQRTEHGAKAAPVQARDLSDPKLIELLGADRVQALRDDIELLDGAGEPVDADRIGRGLLTPAFFGSAMNNFGVELFLNRFIRMAPSPGAHEAVAPKVGEVEICPEDKDFRGFVFKIQANMDPKHRDRVAFLRVVSGKFERDMSVTNMRTGRNVRLTRPQKLFAQDRILMEEAYPGDIVGLTNPGVFQLGDTVYTGAPVRFGNIPRFLPEHFANLRNKKVDKYEGFQKGIRQLSEEGVVQLFHNINASRTEPIVAVVGQLQFDVIRFRLEAEYGVETILEPLGFDHVRWFSEERDVLNKVIWPQSARRVEDDSGHFAVMFDGDWSLNYMKERNPDLSFLEAPPA